MSPTLLLSLALLTGQPPNDQAQADLVAKVANGHHDFYEHVKDLSFLAAATTYTGDVDQTHFVFECLRDKEQSLIFLGNTYHRAEWAETLNQPGSLESVSIARTRGQYRQSLALVRRNRLSPWVVTQEKSVLLSEVKPKTTPVPDEQSYKGQLCTALQATWNTSVLTLLRHPSFRLKAVSEDLSGPERLLTLNFVLDPPPAPFKESGLSPVRSGRITLRPDRSWSVVSSTMEMNAPSKGAELEYTMTITYSPDQKDLPSTVKEVTLRSGRDNQRTEEVTRTNYQYRRIDHLPAEKLSLSQFNLPESEPGQRNRHNDSDTAPPPGSEKRNYLAASNVIPPYAWAAGGLLVGLVLGAGMGRWRRNRRPTTPASGADM